MASSLRSVVVLGGGVGSSTFTRALKDLPVRLTTIVSSFDDGGSTGALRREYGGFALGDFRQCLVASMDLDETLASTLNYRFGPGQLYGVNVGNILLKAFLEQFKSPRAAMKKLHEVLGLRNKVLPVSYDHARLVGTLTDGRVLGNQDQVAAYYSFHKAQFKHISLAPAASLAPDAKEAILRADDLVFAPGNFFSSVLPHLAVKGFAAAWRRSKAQKIWMVNLLAHNGQDSFYSVRDYLRWFEKALGRRPFDVAVLNRKVSPKIMRQVADRYSEVRPTAEDLAYLDRQGIAHMVADLSANEVRGQQANDTVWRAPLRHDEGKIRAFFAQLLQLPP